jgi:putative ATP-dependent endonuclease of the OLD family
MPVRVRLPETLLIVLRIIDCGEARVQIAELRIKGFRGIRDATLKLAKHNILIGPNNCGKSTVIEALALLFGRDRLVRDLTEHDFFGSAPAATDRISIVATLTDFLGDDPDRNPDWFRDGRAIPKWYDPVEKVLHADRTNDRFKLACQIGLAARFDCDDIAVDVIRYFHDDDDVGDVFDNDVVSRIPGQLIRDVGFFLVPANRTWDRTISFGSELFRRVVASIGGPPAAAVLSERDRLRRPADPLESDPGLADIVANVESEVKGLLGKAVSLKLRLTTTDSDGVLDAVVPHYSIDGTQPIPARRQGNGLISLQHLLLLVHFGQLRARQGASFLLAVEEPELHVPPPLQRKLINRIRGLSTQTIIVTHSPVVADGCNPTTLNVVHNNAGTMSASTLLKEPIPLAAPNWQRMLYLVRKRDTITALMHEAVLVPEGRIDFDLLTLLVNADEARRSGGATTNTTDFGSLVGVVPTHEANVVGVYQHLGAIHARVACLVDGDSAGNDYVTSLLSLASPPALILRWPDGWVIEDVISWIVEGDLNTLPGLSAILGETCDSPEGLADLLEKTTAQGGRKGDVVAYELVVAAIADRPECLARIRLLLSCMADAISGRPAPAKWNRRAESTTNTTILEFLP